MRNFVESFFDTRPQLALLRNLVVNKNLNKKQWIYFHLVDFLSPAYSGISLEQFQSLSFAVYGYFRAMLLMDKFLDEPQSMEGGDIFNFLSLNEACIKELSFLFQREDNFWKNFDKAKIEYFKAIKFEKSEWAKLMTIDREDFERLAENKSASLCYPLIEALESLQTQNTHRSKLLKDFLKHLHIAFQYQDDLSDFKKDIDNKQQTYAHFLLNLSLQKNGMSQDISSAFKHKYLFTSGIYSQLLFCSRQNLEICYETASKLKLSDLADFIVNELQNLDIRLKEIELLIQKTKTKLHKSNELRSPNEEINIESINKSINEGVAFIERNIGEDELWADFMTTAGTGKYWVTFYIAYQLATAEFNLPALEKIYDRIFDLQLTGSYNESIPEDGDTLNFMVGFMKSYKGSMPLEAKQNWLKHMKPNGGWATYIHEAALRSRLNLHDNVSMAGWTSPKTCLTATACKMLSFFEGFEKEKSDTEQYLRGNQNKDGYWESYWWTSPIYATSWAIQSLCRINENEEYCNRANKWLLNNQIENGAWLNPFTGEASSFYTAYAVNGLLAFKPEKHLEELKKAAEWLIQKQMMDGSWQTSRVLAIPATDVEDPSKVRHWRKSSFGVNVIVDDHNRVFTAATVLNALWNYRKFFHISTK